MENPLYNNHETFFRLHLNQNWDQDSLGHVWVLQRHKNNTYHWYQSFVKQYTLQQWMKKEEKQIRKMKMKKNSNTNGLLSKQYLLQRLEKIRKIISSNTWDNKVNQAYFELFDVNMQHLMGKSISPSIFGKGTGYDNTIEFEWQIDCIDPLLVSVEDNNK